MLLFGFVYVYLFIPETLGLSLEEVRYAIQLDLLSDLTKIGR